MPDLVRILTDAGIQQFSYYLQRLRAGSNDPPPYSILIDATTSRALPESIKLENKGFTDKFSLGEYLHHELSALDRRKISRDHALWTWLALYYFDEICPIVNGSRHLLEDAVYILDKQFNHQRCYRHLVRTPWLTVSDHGENARVLLTMRDKGTRSEIFEQLASSQGLLGNRTVIAGAYKLYFDTEGKKPKRGTGGKGPGSPRRLVKVVKQLELTYDLNQCTAAQFISLLPKEFNKFTAANESISVPRKSPFKKLFGLIKGRNDSQTPSVEVY